jgi:hypothetical protein
VPRPGQILSLSYDHDTLKEESEDFLKYR